MPAVRPVNARVPEAPLEMVRDVSMRIYTRYMGEGAQAEEPRSWSVDPENNLIQLTPRRTYVW